MPTIPARMIRDGSTLDYERLCEETRSVVQDSDKTQREIANALDVTESSVSRALKTPGPKFQALQRRIIAYLTDYEVEEDPRFKVRRRPST